MRARAKYDGYRLVGSIYFDGGSRRQGGISSLFDCYLIHVMRRIYIIQKNDDRG